MLTDKAVILARGLGTRMRARKNGVALTDEQSRLADAGIKALIPVWDGRTLLELIVENLVAADFQEICLVIGTEHDVIREFCSQRQLGVTFAVQNEALGTADAVLAAEPFIEPSQLFLAVNSDNLYPIEALRLLRATDRPALLAFEREALIERSNIPDERVSKFASVEVDDRGRLKRIVEKPRVVEPDSLVSMNAWLFSPAIFEACRAIAPSERGEYEITSAVQYAIDELGEEFVAVRTNAGVLDLSSRDDIAGVGKFIEKS